MPLMLLRKLAFQYRERLPVGTRAQGGWVGFILIETRCFDREMYGELRTKEPLIAAVMLQRFLVRATMFLLKERMRSIPSLRAAAALQPKEKKPEGLSMASRATPRCPGRNSVSADGNRGSRARVRVEPSGASQGDSEASLDS